MNVEAGHKKLVFVMPMILTFFLLSAACVSTRARVRAGPSAGTGTRVSAASTASLMTSPLPPAPTALTPANEESTKRMLNLLSSGDFCDLPCFWGVRPGESWSAAREQLKEFVAHIADSTQDNGSILHEIPSDVAMGKQGITFHVAIREQAGIIESIMGQINSARFLDTLKPLTPQQVALAYGVPTDIRLFVSTNRDRATVAYYHLWNLYTDKGFYVLYLGYARRFGAIYEICPSVPHFELSSSAATVGYTAQYGEVMFGSTSANNEAAIEAIAKEADETFAQTRATDVVTDLGDAALIKLIEQDSTNGCFSTPSSIWEH